MPLLTKKYSCISRENHKNHQIKNFLAEFFFFCDFSWFSSISTKSIYAHFYTFFTSLLQEGIVSFFFKKYHFFCSKYAYNSIIKYCFVKIYLLYAFAKYQKTRKILIFCQKTKKKYNFQKVFYNKKLINIIYIDFYQ